MAYRMRTAEEKQELVAALRQSRMSKTRFARERGLPASAFSRWIARVEGLETEGTRFLPVHVVADLGPSVSNLVVHVSGSGHRIEVPVGFDAGELQRLVQALC